MKLEYTWCLSFNSTREQLLAPLAEDQLAYVMTRCLLCVCACVRSPVRALTFIFKHLLWIYLSNFDEVHRNDTARVLFRICWKNLIPSKTLFDMATELKKNWNSLKNLLVWNNEAHGYQI